MNDPLHPSVDLLVKLGSLVVHFEEQSSTTGHYLDELAIESLRSDPDVNEWFQAMNKMALLPVKR